jgi:NAD(P)-dependent dehydrogenase (short-subunit alcohol dehydrogenase family)
MRGTASPNTRAIAPTVPHQARRNAVMGAAAVAPGPIWSPLIPSTCPEKVNSFGADVPLQRPGQPEEVAPSYGFLASDDGSCMTGQVLHPNGGSVVNG